MNREIKFRAKPIGINNFVYGYYCKDFEGKAYITTLDGVDTYTLDSKTVGQYTGLKDKNGKEIYEGDIVIVCEDRMGIKLVIEKYKTGFEFNQRNWGARLYESAMANNIEIIGNVYENPEIP